MAESFLAENGDGTVDATGDGPRARGRAQRAGAGSSGGERVPDEAAGTRPSNTYLQTRQSGAGCPSLSSSPPCDSTFTHSSFSSVFAIDWWESSGVVEWHSPVAAPFFHRLHDHQRQAREWKSSVPVEFGRRSMLLRESGMGRGRQAHLEFVMECGPMMLAFSTREKASRKLANLYLKIPGEACLLWGAEQTRDEIISLLREHGGVLVDEWVRRIDLCLDLPGCDLRESLMPAFEAGQFLTSAKKWNLWDGVDGKTGFTFGSRPGLLLNVYDKLREVTRRDEAYRLAMMERRWGGVVPAAATRVEYQIGKAWLDQYGLRTAENVLVQLPDIVAKLVGKEPRHFVYFTNRVPDRDNRHQSRVEVHSIWGQIVEAMQQSAGEPRSKLRPIERASMSLKGAWGMVLSGLTTAAARTGRYCASLDDAKQMLELLHERNGGSDEDWERRWEQKARKLGTFDETVSFPPFDERNCA